MLDAAEPAPGVLVVSVGAGTSPDVEAAAAQLGPRARTAVDRGGMRIVVADLDAECLTGDAQRRGALLLNLEPRRHEASVSAIEAARLVDEGSPDELVQLLPPFAALTLNNAGDEVRAVADWLGFRQVYHRSGDGWAALSTSARALAALAPAGLDRVAMGTQSRLGWQIGLRTPFADVHKLAPRSIVTLRAGRLALRPDAITDPIEPITLEPAVAAAAAVLRSYVPAYLDDNPGAMLQLTGGLDSRTLLAAIPVGRRRGLEVMTVAVPGSEDLDLAAAMVQRYGMVHRVVPMGGLEALEPDDVHAMAVAMARRVEYQADPVAATALAWTEAKIDQSPRLVGLGGEVTRGFYYFGPMRTQPITRFRVERLAKWRLFPNGAVPAHALNPDFAASSYETTINEAQRILEATGTDWLRATDEFYLGQRMHRWAGVLSSGTSFDRAITNPMLDDRFIRVARGLPPKDKKNMRFLSRLLVALDDDLGEIPLDARPAPRVYARPGVRSRVELGVVGSRRVVKKVGQRVARRGRVPAGGAVVTAKVAEFWQRNPTSLDGVRGMKIFDEGFLDRLCRGEVAADSASVALLVNLEALASAR